MRFAFVAASLLLIVPSIDAAAVSPAKRALIEEVIRVSNAHVLGAALSLDLIIGSTRKPELIDVARARLILLSDDEAVRKATIDAFADVYAASFTEKELGELLALYKTDLGQKLAALPVKLETEGRANIARVTGEELEKAIQLSKVKRTMAEMLTLSMAVNSYLDEHKTLPPALSIDDLPALLAPYSKRLWTADAWGKPFRYMATTSTFRIVSGGSDGVIDPSSRRMGRKPSPSDDLVLEDLEFLLSPVPPG